MKKLVSVLTLLLVAVSFSFGQVVVKEWQVPFLNCLTGSIAAIGEYMEWSAEYAAKEINAAGGIAGKPVKVVPVDTALDPQKGSVEMAKLVKDSLVSMGPVPEAVIMAAMPIAVENGMLSMTASTSYEYAAKFFPWSVSWFPPTKERLPPLVMAWAKQFKDMNQVVQFIEPYGPWPMMAETHSVALKNLNIKELPKVDVSTDTVVFSPLAVKALAQKPDGVIIVTSPDKAAKLVKELKNLGWTKMDHILIFSSADDVQLYATGGADLNGVEIYNFINPDLHTPRWDAFQVAYMASHNNTPVPSLASNYYDALYMIKEAIEKAGVTGDPKLLKVERKKIADYIANMQNFQGLLFEWDMKDGVAANKPTFIFQIQNSKKKLVKEVRPQ